MNILESSCIFFHIFFSFSFIFFSFSVHFLFIFFHFLFIFFLFSFHFLFIFFHFLSLFFCYFLSFFFFLFFFYPLLKFLLFFCLDCLTISFLSSYFLQLNFLGRLGKYPIGPSFFLVYCFIFFIFVFFSISFHVFSSFFFLFHFFSFCFFSKINVSFFFILFLFFSFVGCSKSVAALQDSLVQSAHFELALFALYWLVVTFPCGMVHIMVMIRLRVVFGGRRVGQVLPSNQNHQIGAFDETADAPQSSLFSLLFFSLQLSSINTYLSSPARSHLAGRSRAAPLVSCGIMHILKKFARRLGKKESRPGGSPNSLGNNEHSGKALYFLSFCFIFFFLFFFSFYFSFSFHFLSFSFHFLYIFFPRFFSCSFSFFHFHSFSFQFRFILFHFLSVSFIFFFHLLSFKVSFSF